MLSRLGRNARGMKEPSRLAFAGSFTSPVRICTHGTLTGGFPSKYDFVMDTLVPTRIPGVFAYTGHSLITVQSGATLTGATPG